jgi:hypothetical protein
MGKGKKVGIKLDTLVKVPNAKAKPKGLTLFKTQYM